MKRRAWLSVVAVVCASAFTQGQQLMADVGDQAIVPIDASAPPVTVKPAEVVKVAQPAKPVSTGNAVTVDAPVKVDATVTTAEIKPAVSGPVKETCLLYTSPSPRD